jgi:hypothetical protein
VTLLLPSQTVGDPEAQLNFEALQQWLARLGTDIGNTAGLSSAQIDALFPSLPPDATVAFDQTNALLLLRTSGKWVKFTGTAIA